ncbi:non-SMC mitotic condensation complex subunit 1 [Lactifluus volemus]|nr:non-SMC mitotic condensation complex subunit 1 [Lactifluus volemus]
MSGFAAGVDAAAHDIDHEDQQTCAAHKVPMEMYAFLLNWTARSVEKVDVPNEDASAATAPVKSQKGRGGKATQSRVASKNKAAEWSWKDQIVPILPLIANVLKLKTSKIWTVSGERDTFIGAKRLFLAQWVSHYACSSISRSNITGMGLPQTSIMKSLKYYEHLSESMAECLNVLLREFDHAQLGEEILREIAAKSFNAQDIKGPRNFSRFLTQFAEWAPQAVLKQISLLLLHLDSEFYPMRMAIVEIIGCLICELACSEDLTSDTHQMQKQLNSLYDLLLERTLDHSFYVHSKVFTVLSRLCDLPVKFPKQCLAITRAAVSALEDKVAGVLRNAISLIVKLIVTHPYGLMHGGLLGMEEWEDRSGEGVTENGKGDTLSGNAGEAGMNFTARPVKKRSRRRNKDSEDAINVDEQDGDEGGDSDEVDSIMDEDELDPVFRKLQEAIEHPCRSCEWFALAEQAINTVYTLGNQPDDTLIKSLSRRVFRQRQRPVPSTAEEQVSSAVPGALTGNTAKKSDDTGDAFELSQLRFVMGHVVVKHIVYLELVEREWKRQKQENELAEKLAGGTGNDATSKGGEELDQVAGNAEDEIGDRIAAQVPLCELAILRRRPSPALPHPGDVEGPSFSTTVDENSDEWYRGQRPTRRDSQCLQDEEPRIADLAKLFFTNLFTKDNTIYNNLPDVINHLSVGDPAIRFRLTGDTRQWRDIAFCLSLLPFKSECSVKKLIEGLPFYRDKLYEEGGYARFQEVLVKARSNKTANKPNSEENEFESLHFP